MSDYDDFELPEPTLQNIINEKTLKWIFVGGKGGVGKTTTSCSLAIQLAKNRENVLIISTDPAHNLSDAFKQKFSPNPTLIQGFKNLFCMELDASATKDFSSSLFDGTPIDPSAKSSISSMLNDITSSFPGIDEAMGFSELMKQVQTMNYSCIVFDTAPTGHTLRLISFPSMLEGAISKLSGIKDQMSGLFSGLGALTGDMSVDKIFGKINELKDLTDKVNKQFRTPSLTTFICVCIPEFLSVYETERLVQELTRNEMDTHNIVVNQVLFPEKDSHCLKCLARQKMQSKYLDQINELYEDFHILILPQMNEEIRGTEALTAFSQYLLTPYE